MSLTKLFKTDETAERKGAKFELPANEDGSIPAFYIARMSASNVKWNKTLEAVTKPHKRALQLGIMPEAESRALMVEAFVKALLTGWDNILQSDVTGEVTDSYADGTAVYAPYTQDNAMALLVRLPELYNALNGFAQTMQNYLEQEKAEETKN